MSRHTAPRAASALGSAFSRSVLENETRLDCTVELMGQCELEIFTHGGFFFLLYLHGTKLAEDLLRLGSLAEL